MALKKYFDGRIKRNKKVSYKIGDPYYVDGNLCGYISNVSSIDCGLIIKTISLPHSMPSYGVIQEMNYLIPSDYNPFSDFLGDTSNG